MPAVRSFARKISKSRSLYLQLLFVTLAFALLVLSSGIFVNEMLVNYLKRDAVNILMQTRIRIVDDLLEPETLMIPIARDVRDIIIHGGGAEDVLEYFNGISTYLYDKKEGFIFDGLHGYFEAFGNLHIPAPGWTVPDGYNATERLWYKAAVEANGKIVITPMFLSQRSGEYEVNAACRIFDDSGAPLGVIAMNIQLHNIARFVADMHLVEGGYGFLANEDFVLIAHHEKEFVMKNMSEISSGFRQIMEKMEQGANFAKVDGINYKGVRSVFYCERIENGWYLGIMTPKNLYYRDVRILMSFLGVLGFVLMLAVDIILVRIDIKKSKLNEEIREQRIQLETQAAMREMERAIEEKNVFANLVNVLDGLDTMIYITDPATNEILFINENMKEHYGVEGDVVGQICYKIFQKGISGKCSFCPCNQLDKEYGTAIVWEEHSTLTDRVYRNVDRYIDWLSGKKVHLQQSVDITDLRTMTDTLNKRLEQQSIMTNISQSLLSAEDMDVLITKVLRMAGEFMGIDQALILVGEGDGISLTCRNSWMNPEFGFPTRLGVTVSLNKAVLDIIQEAKDKKCFYVTSDDPVVREVIRPYRFDFYNYLLSFVFLDDKLYAIIDFSMYRDDIKWDQDKISMASFVTNIVVGLKTMTNALDKRVEQQSLMTYISQSFLSTEDIDVLITRVLRMVGEFIGFDQILMHIMQDNEASFICKNEWINPKLGLTTRVGGNLYVSKDVWDIVRRLKEQKIVYATSNDPDVREAISPYRVNFRDYILTCVFLDDKLYAVIDFSKEGDGSYIWNQDEINIASYVTSVLVGALNKRLTELQLIAAKETAEQNNRSKGIFLAHMSHEIRTPMNAILGISEIQLQDKTLAPESVEAFRQIYDSGNLLLNIINDILDFSKVEAGKLEIVPVIYNIPSLLSDTAQLNRLRYESKPIEFMIHVNESMPLKLFGDELRIKQILNNLLSNAFKYTDKGKVELSVYVEPKVREPKVREPKVGEPKVREFLFDDDVYNDEIVTLVFKVSDTGQGMREDQIERLFDEYSRFNMQTNRGISGTGLGMSITKRLIDMMNGEILVESKAGEGSTFTVRLPQESVGSATCGAEVIDSLRNFTYRSMTISKKAQIVHEYMPYGSVLVVDDIASNLYIAKGLLTPYGLRIETAASGTEAVEKIKNGSLYDIVFMDHMMPVMDGMEAVKIIRDMGYTRPIIALTANAIAGQSDIFLANGFDGFIPKPIDSRELNAVLDHLIRDKQPREVIEATRREQHERTLEAKDMADIHKYFVLDGENAVRVIEETYAKLPDAQALESYITAVHGIKSVLANIGETELSGAALKLEQAGYERDFTIIREETSAFTDALKFLINKLRPSVNEEAADIAAGDMAYLQDKLLAVKKACDAFDIIAAKDALDDLKLKSWPANVNVILDEISVHLLHSAFKKAAAAAQSAVKM